MTRNRFFGRYACFATALMVIGLVIFGCGGGGGGGGTDSGVNGTTSSQTNGTNNSTGSVANVVLVPVYKGTQSPASSSGWGVGDQIQFEYVGNSSTNNNVYKVVSGGAVSTTAPASVATLAGGILTVAKSSTPTTYTVTGSYGGQALNASFTTTAQFAKVSGLVLDPSGAGVVGVPVNFYNSSGTKVASSTTGIDGSFIGEVPSTATQFGVDFTLYASYYYNEFAFGSFDFTVATGKCYAPLPKLTVGHTVALPNNVVPFYYDPNSPPPPPTGCN